MPPSVLATEDASAFAPQAPTLEALAASSGLSIDQVKDKLLALQEKAKDCEIESSQGVKMIAEASASYKRVLILGDDNRVNFLGQDGDATLVDCLEVLAFCKGDWMSRLSHYEFVIVSMSDAARAFSVTMYLRQHVPIRVYSCLLTTV